MNLLTPTHRWQKCFRKALGTHDWIWKLAALSLQIVRTAILGRKKVMQPMIWIRYNRINKFLTWEPAWDQLTASSLPVPSPSKGGG